MSVGPRGPGGMPVASILRQQVRCPRCGARLFDTDNAVTAGAVLVEIKCRRSACGAVSKHTFGAT